MASIPFALAEGGHKCCSKCGAEKPVGQFYADPRKHDGLRPSCKDCYRAGLTPRSTRRTPEQKADYRRRKCGVIAPYRTADQITADAVIRRDKQEQRRSEYRLLLEQQAVSRERRSSDPQYQEMVRAQWRERYHDTSKEQLRPLWRSVKHTKRAHAHGTDSHVTATDVRALLASAASCAYCGADLTTCDGGLIRDSDATIDHIVALARGGSHMLSNLTVACWGCNASKRNHPIEAWVDTLPEARRPAVLALAAQAMVV